MRSRALPSVLVLTLSLAAAPRGVAAGAGAGGAGADRTLSPYFVVEGAAPGVEALPLESTRAQVNIAGVIADVVVTQRYQNRGTTPISARYVFPASTRAAVHGMTMKVADRVIEARIRERGEARKEYETARAAGKTASLLEEQRPNVFSMEVANILPEDLIEVELRYTELLVPTDGVYELVYPTVVGPRYAGESVDGRAADNQFVATPYRRPGRGPAHAFGLEVTVAAGMPIQAIESPSHRIETQFAAGRGRARVALAGDQAAGGDRDFVLRYRLGGREIATGLLLHRGKTENFFLMMVQPPQRPALELIPPREYVFIVDVSGSMRGFPLEVSKRLMRELLSGLRPTDRFNVLLFSGTSQLMAERSVEASAAQIDRAVGFIDQQHGGGGTELLAAVRRALALPRPAEGVARSFVVVTDGYIAEEPAVFETIRANLGQASVFAFGIGSSVNRHLIEGIAAAGRGEPFVALDQAQAVEVAGRLRAYLEAPVLTGVSVAFDGFEVHDVEPVVLPDVFARRPVIVFGKWRGEPTGTITLSGVSGRGRFVSRHEVASEATSSDNRALAYLWARSRIAALSDFYQGDANRDAVVGLGLRYNLLTRYTSFVAVHQQVRAAGTSGQVDQPLPLPQGVSGAAIGFEEGPEPPLVILLAIVALAAGWRRWRRSASAARAA
jgi:Ca-activated chloride channel homolog